MPLTSNLQHCFCNARSGVKSSGMGNCLELRQHGNHTQGLLESLSLKISHFLPLQEFDMQTHMIQNKRRTPTKAAILGI